MRTRINNSERMKAVRAMIAGQAECDGVLEDGLYIAKNDKTYRRVNGSDCEKCAGGRVDAKGRVDFRLCGELPECQAIVGGEFVFMVWVEVEV